MNLFTICYLILFLFLGGCHRPVSHGEIRFALSQPPLNLDPRYATDAVSERINHLLYRSLVAFDSHSRPIPDLATWVEDSPTHFRFSLVSDSIRFHDKEVLTSRDVAATYRSILELKDSPHSAEFSNILEIRSLDDRTLDFYLKRPDKDFPSRMVLGVMPALLITQGHDFSHHPVGCGPLKFVSWQNALVLERLGDQQRFVLQDVKDPTVRVLKLVRGEVDLLQGDLPPEMVAYLKGIKTIQVKEIPGSNFSYMGFNAQDPVLNDVRVRKAVALSIDRQAILRYAMVGGSREAGAILPPEHWAGNADLIAYEYDPVSAKELLREAGVGLPLKLVYKTSTDPQRVRLATIMQSQMQAAGIDLEIRSLDWGTFFNDIKRGDFQLYGLTWVGIRTPEIYRLAFHSEDVPPRGSNRGGYSDPVLDKLIDEEDWQGATRRIHEQLPYVPLWYEGQFVAMRSGLKDFAPRADGNWDSLATIHY